MTAFHSGVVVRSTDDLTISRPNVDERIALSSAVTGGSLTCLELVVRPGGLVAPVHVHTREDETVFVVDGKLSVRLGDRTIHAEAGSVVFGPRRLAHAFWNEGGSTARLVMTVTPGENFEAYFRGLPAAAGEDPAAAAEKLVQHAATFGLELRPDSLEELAERHHVTLF